ncbi:MAG: exonuclease SbcCD subunit D [Oscillospiraceae bacterium]|nr:exonuclease SbcCD subunit D [Oscillospiraceae bacterium]
MRFLHLSDLHLGKMLYGVSLLDNGDQPDWVGKLLAVAEEKRPDAVVIAGDVYDRSMPSGAAMQLFSQMVTELSNRNVPVLIAAGNHDSGERISCFKDILAQQNVFIAGEPQREITHVTLSDENGPVTFWLLPYVFPAAVAKILEDDTIHDYDTAVRRLLAQQHVDFSQRNVIVAHQNVTNCGKEGIRGGSESMVGGVGQVDYTAFDGFDYAALGHIHAAYAIGRETVRYAGSAMCYHFDELRQPKKGPVYVELGEKGTEPQIETLTIPPLHPMYELRGTYDELRAKAATVENGAYVKLVLTDCAMTPEISAYFQALFDSRGSVLMERLSEFRRFSELQGCSASGDLRQRPVDELFMEFYSLRSVDSESLDEGDAALLRYAAELLRNSDAGADGKYVDPKLPEQMLEFLSKEGN